MEKKIEPNFAHFGIEGGVNFVFATDLEWQGKMERVIFVGSNAGKCFLCVFRTSKLLPVYEDSDRRQITSMGIWPFEEVQSESSALDHNLLVWIHFRGSAVEVFEFRKNEDVKLHLRKSIDLAHYGFCKALSDMKRGYFFLPDYENSYNMLRIRYRSGGEKCYSLSEDFLVKSFVKRQAGKEASLLDSKTIEGLQLFKGLLMAIEVGIDSDHPDRILMAFEDSTVCIFDLRTKEVIDCLKHPKYHQFLCLAVKKKPDDLLISVSVMGQVYLLKYVFSQQALHSCCVIKRSKSMNCSTMAFSPVTDLGQSKLVCGFSSGLVEMFDIKKDGQEVSKMVVTEFHEGSIQCMTWVQEDAHNESEDHLIIGSADGKLAIYSDFT